MIQGCEHQAGSSRLGGEILFILAILTGIVLRFYRLHEQILLDDEWHSLKTALKNPFSYIFTHFEMADHCIPFTLYNKAAYSLSGLSEWVVRGPVLFFGILSLIVLPLMVRHVASRSTACIFAWLLAVSPLHIFYSRFARPYGIALFLVITGVLAAHRWWVTGKRNWAVLYVICAATGPYFHLIMLPFALAPLGLFGIRLLFEKRNRPLLRWKDLIMTGAMTALLLACFLVPPLVNDFSSLSAKAGKGEPLSWFTMTLASELWSGVIREDLRLLMLAGMVLGAALLLRRNFFFGVYLGALLVIQALAVWITSPKCIEFGITLARYGLVIMPIALLFLAESLGGLEKLGSHLHTRLPAGTLGPLIAAALFFAGPLPDDYRAVRNYMHHAIYYSVYNAKGRKFFGTARVVPKNMPEFYMKLGREPPGSIRLMEAPWYSNSIYNAQPAYQHYHRQWVTIGFVQEDPSRFTPHQLPLQDPKLRFRNFVHLGDHEGLAKRKIRYAVFHRNLRDELPRPDSVPEVSVESWIAQYRARYGEPVFEGQGIVAFDLAGADRRTPISDCDRAGSGL